MSDDLLSLGPAMRALTEKQRAYVLAMASDPFGTPTAWARAAGYSDTKEGAKVRGHHLAHNPKIEAAAQEVARSCAMTLGPLLGFAVVSRIARDKDHPKHFQAGVALMDRGGLPMATEHNVRVAHVDQSGTAMLGRIEALAKALGVDPAVLLGVNAPSAPAEPVKLIDVTPAKV